MKPVDRLRRIERKRVALMDEAAALNPPQLAARPAPGKWTIRDIIEHLVRSEQNVMGDLSGLSVLEEQPRDVTHHARYLLVVCVLRFGIPVRTPSMAMEPTGEGSLADLGKTWAENHRRLRLFVGGLDRRGTRRAVFRHPVAGPITVAQGIRLLELHLDTHSRQVRRLARLALTIQESQ